MKVAYVLSTSGHTASYKLGKMILPQLEQGIILMLCDQCALERGLAEGGPGGVPSAVRAAGAVEGVQVGCFPVLYAALAGNLPDQLITL